MPPHLDTPQLLTNLQARAKKINTFAAWLRRQEQIITALCAELAQVRAELAAERQLTATLTAVLNMTPDNTPPQQLVNAWRRGGDHYVDFVIDGVKWIVPIEGPPRAPDPIREHRDWLTWRECFRALDVKLRQAGV